MSEHMNELAHISQEAVRGGGHLPGRRRSCMRVATWAPFSIGRLVAADLVHVAPVG